ncbi:MAG TPA: glutamine synthetase family protein [Jatrophihabitans sp.]|jgi:glutamine synthetase|uniref:glutamine synthetase family protein n=1 Tax=Jatrophihabitans sp. TaxID=1932789 RepID=UPI002DF755D9|nr:glutamine synthetase family protein [Jatrophihabitans sp.]
MAPAPMSLEQLRIDVEHDTVDTVIVAMTDMQGRLQGKRIDARHFLHDVLGHGTEGCNYLLAVDVEMNTVDGYAISSWETGYGDFVLDPDMHTLRRLAWQPGTALVLADVLWLDRRPVAESPRQILRRQLDRLAERGWTAFVGTELEFILFDDTYEQAFSRHYADLTPSNQYNVDYSIVGTSRVEPLLRAIRLGMRSAGMQVESVKGECNFGQHEIAFKYDDALTTCDNHVVYKTGAKEIAAQHGSSLTFMAKYDAREGNSCHIHLSLRTADGDPVFAGDGPHGTSPVFDKFVAGQLAGLRELSCFFAPNVNSYKRYQPATFAPTAVKWGIDNRTCAIRVVGHGSSLRFENRLPGGDVNPYLAVAAMIASGLYGIDNDLELEDPLAGNAYAVEAEHVPTTLREAAGLWSASTIAREAFGDAVVDHYANTARVELAAFDAAVTDWERVRNFERM